MSTASQYVLSLPERVLRSASALAGGILHELGEATLPEAVRRSRLYVNLVEISLRFIIEEVGEVEGVFPGEERLNRDFLVSRTAGGGLEMIGLLAFRASPVWVLAALADATGAGRQLLSEITRSLKEQGLIAPDADIRTVDHMLDGLEQTASRTANAINAPPLDVAGLRREWAALRIELAKLPPRKIPSPAAVTGTWRAIVEEARRQQRSVFEMSSVMALSAVGSLPERAYRLSRSAVVAGERTGAMFAGPLLEHYRKTLADIRQMGFLAYWTIQFRPYLRAAATQFSPAKGSLTQRVLSYRPGKRRPDGRD